MTKSKQKQVLGRGLDSLLGNSGIDISGSSSISEIPVSKIYPNPDQPRKEFDTKALDELASSISSIGLVQPITVQDVGNGQYMIISGERRWRACKSVGIEAIPAYIRTVDDDQIMEMALVENIQREDLNAIEVALAYRKLLDNFNLTQDTLGQRLGKGRATISNYLRLLKLPAEVQLGLCQHKVDMGHARALLQLDDAKKQIILYEKILEENLSVRQVEMMARDFESLNLSKSRKPKNAEKEKTKISFQSLEENLSHYFQAKVSVNCNDKGKGKLSIAFGSEDELERIMMLLEKIQKN